MTLLTALTLRGGAVGMWGCECAVVMKMLEQKIGKENFQNLVRLIVTESCESTGSKDGDERDSKSAAAAPSASASAASAGAGVGDGKSAPGIKQPLSTKWLIRQAIRASSEQDMKTFFDLWVFGDGYPQVKAVFNFNRKKHVTEIVISQVCGVLCRAASGMPCNGVIERWWWWCWLSTGPKAGGEVQRSGAHPHSRGEPQHRAGAAVGR